MENYINFFNSYVIGMIQMLTGFYFYRKFLQKRERISLYLLSAALGCVVMQAAPAKSIAQYLIYTLLLVIIGIFICRADWKSVILYAVLTVEIMQLSLGIVNSLSGIVQPKLSYAHRNVSAQKS